MKKQLRKIELLSDKKTYLFHKWLNNDRALIEDKEGYLITVSFSEFRFKNKKCKNESK